MKDTAPAVEIAATMWIGSSLAEGKMNSHLIRPLVERPDLSLLD